MIVNVQAARRIHDQYVTAVVHRLPPRFLGQPLHQRCTCRLALQVALIDIRFDRTRYNFQLLARGWPVHVDRDQHRPMATLLQPRRQLAGGRGFARALQPRHQDHRRRPRGEVEARRVLAQNRDQFIAHDLDDLLGRRERRHHLAAHRLLANVLDHLLHHGEVHVRFQQRHPDLAQCVVDVLFGNRAFATQVLKGTL